MSAQFASPLAVVLGFHGIVERIDHPEIQVNHIPRESFEHIVERVRTEYEVVTLDDVAAAVRGELTLPERAAALTFDDAYRSVLDLADPLLSRHGVPYAVFVPSGLVDTGSRVPTYVLRAALAYTKEGSVRLPGRRRAFSLRTLDDRERAANHAADLLRSVTQADAREVLSSLRAVLSEDEWADVDSRFPSEELLGWGELRALAERGITVGSHTRDHAVLHGGQDAAEIEGQLRESKAAIEEHVGRPCLHFCFPHGQPRDISREAVAAARSAGYSTAFMSVGGPVREGMDPLLLPRIPVGGSPAEAAMAERVQLSHSKWYRTTAAELGVG